MTSNVELVKPDLQEITDDPSIDAFTQRPRTPNRPRRCSLFNQSTIRREDTSSLFSHALPVPKGGYFPKDRYAYTIKGENLYGKSKNLQYIGEIWSRCPKLDRDGSRAGAYFPWPPDKAGDKILKHLHNESIASMQGIELRRRPPTNLPGPITMAFGRATPGYYALRYPNRETWTNSTVRHGRDPNFLYGLHERTFAHYEMCDERQKRYLDNLPETTEYQDRYLGHLPTGKQKVLYTRDCPQ
ncbi:hypothetical protein FGIG_02319 [Fasciola gigantica]|uniref:Uncharacterized protein n=1 Tax=Fasciola gigantica TaxID=46835 RepID=A0A504YU37_FASGI|nr:hypothetical protein FGIG_02319 [Fasciola gigantica]